ncbi:hypothetical protein [Anianabacter salinae]|uniref:hypothetical protein n=1 Tax=Anianabacter salinae TaxID=2851023 RepID=UPI00225E2AE1|nr:hypothetical protein [Anianabacter salinae]MBV0914114.1 hypothetical protein [Anianabacter salinae]
MLWKPFLFVLWLILAAAQANAQSSRETCPTAPRDLLVGLDGTWSVQQGPGVMIVPVMGALPLPPHAPLRLTMAYDPETGTSQLTGNGPNEQLIMFPTHESLVPQIQEMVSAADKENLLNIGTDCDWYALPLMVGTNTYSLESPGFVETGTTVLALFLPGVSNELTQSAIKSTAVCLTGKDKQEIADLMGGGRAQNMIDALENVELAGPLFVAQDFGCAVTPSSGEMTMTLLVKFQSPESGTGMLIFEVNQGGTRAIAKAPVTMSR